MKRLRLGFELGFDIWGLVLLLLVMLPNIIWFFIPAPNDVLRRESVTPIVDIIESVFQILTIACLCFVIKKERPQLRFSSLIIFSIASNYIRAVFVEQIGQWQIAFLVSVCIEP